MAPLDVLIVGGGPAGATAAILLARAGRSVAVLEKARFPRRKVCGEFVAPHAVQLLQELGFENPGKVEIRRIALWAGNSIVGAALPPPYARTIAREELDQLLLERAAACGARVFQPAAALRLERTATGIACIARPSLEIEARAIIAAHGSWEAGSLPTQPRHLPPQAADLLAFKAHFRGCGAPTGTIALVPFPGGYAGVVEIGGGRATFACCIRRERLEELRTAGLPAGESAFRYALSMSRGMREAFDAAVREGPWLASGPLRPGARPLYRDGIFAVGNAAGEVHPVIGEGIAIAMSSARALCQPLIAALEAGYPPAAQAAVAREYERRWQRIFRRRHWSSACFARLAMRPAAAAWANLALRRTPSLLTLAARLSS